jgi:hypothetical protein
MLNQDKSPLKEKITSFAYYRYGPMHGGLGISKLRVLIKKDMKKIFLQFFVIKTLDPYPYPDSLEMLDPYLDPESINSDHPH